MGMIGVGRLDFSKGNIILEHHKIRFINAIQKNKKSPNLYIIMKCRVLIPAATAVIHEWG